VHYLYKLWVWILWMESPNQSQSIQLESFFWFSGERGYYLKGLCDDTLEFDEPKNEPWAIQVCHNRSCFSSESHRCH
jgi:hypothetical protein